MVWKNWGRWGTLSPPQFFDIDRVQTPLFVSPTSHSCQLRDPRQTGHKKKCLYPLFRALPWFRVKAPSGQLGLGSSPASGQLTAVLTLTLGVTLGVSCFHSVLSKLQALQAGDCPGGTDTAVSQPGAYLNKQHQGWEAPENPRRQEWLSPNVICPQPPEAYASVSCRWSSSPTLSVSEAKL